MGALADISAKMTRGARGWFEAFLVGIIVSNPLLADGQPVFSAAHANLSATPAAPGDTAIAEGKLGMRLQTDLSGNPLNLTPTYLFIPAALENTVDQLLARLYPAQPSEALVAARTLTPVVDSRLDQAGQSKSLVFVLRPVSVAVFEYSDLEGYAGPQVQAAELFTRSLRPGSSLASGMWARARSTAEEAGKMRAKDTSPVDTLRAQAAALVNAIAAGVRVIETPQLGRVEYNGTGELITALNLINGQIAALVGGPSRTQPVIALRGLWPREIEGRVWQ